MTPITSLRVAGAILLPLAAVTALVASCSNNDNPQPQVPIYTTDSGGAVDTGGAPPDAGAGNDGESSEGSSQDAPVVDAAIDVDAAACTTDAGCWSCTPSTASQFLNQCTTSTCSPFANGTRIPGYDGGALPSLP
jgi:hypothetical protein